MSVVSVFDFSRRMSIEPTKKERDLLWVNGESTLGKGFMIKMFENVVFRPVANAQVLQAVGLEARFAQLSPPPITTDQSRRPPRVCCLSMGH